MEIKHIFHFRPINIMKLFDLNTEKYLIGFFKLTLKTP
jgi:hypothetical protein